AAWVTSEPMIAEMRLQWWLDMVTEIREGRPACAHEVAAPLTELIAETELPLEVLEGMINARQFDIYKSPHADQAAFDTYIDRTNGNLTWLTALALGAEVKAEPTVRDAAFAGGVAAILAATPKLILSGRAPLYDGSAMGIKIVAEEGLARLEKSRAGRKTVSRDARAALRAGWQAKNQLQQAMRAPEALAVGWLDQSEFAKKSGLLWRTLRNVW
ncbi:MAG: squalene/phytoene synthase family protein, partial [Alphaproteobacteria bacterium]|nr:squalene/phytoene synthase family protein [Alphaproteobacteria bacterium]